MPYALRGSILSMSWRVLNVVENLTRSQKIHCIFFKTAAWQKDFHFGVIEKRDPQVPSAGPGGHRASPSAGGTSPCPWSCEDTDLPLPSWSGPSLPSLVVHEGNTGGNTQIQSCAWQEKTKYYIGAKTIWKNDNYHCKWFVGRYNQEHQLQSVLRNSVAGALCSHCPLPPLIQGIKSLSVSIYHTVSVCLSQC